MVGGTGRQRGRQSSCAYLLTLWLTEPRPAGLQILWLAPEFAQRIEQSSNYGTGFAQAGFQVMNLCERDPSV